MHKILVEVRKQTLSFSLYGSRQKVENLNDTNIINTEKMIFSDNYINDNLDLIRSFFNLVVLKKNVKKVNVSINAIFPLVARIIEDIPNIKTVVLLEDKAVGYSIFEHLLRNDHIEEVECYSIPSFMYDKLDAEKGMKVKSRCEVLFLSNFMESNNFNTYSDIYYKKVVNIDCNLDKIDKDDIISFFKFNNKLKIVNVFNVDKDIVNFILDLIDENNKRNVKVILHQLDDFDKEIIPLTDSIIEKNKKIIKKNNIKVKIDYTSNYRDRNTLKQINLNFFRFILLLFIILAIIAGIVFYIKMQEDTDSINEEMEEIGEVIDLNKIDEYLAEEEEFVENEIIEDEEEKKNPSGYVSPYYRKFTQVFADLLKINNETVGWLKVNNTKINYPITQHSDNEYYLNHSFYKYKNSHGWVFMDYRNSIDTLDKNTIIYGHRNKQGLMFGTLKNVLEESWYTNKNNQIITFNTLNQDMKWQIFSIYTIKNTNDYINNKFSSNDTFIKFINMIQSRSIYDFGIEVTADDNILTLSTCYNGPEHRLVVHAKLIK